MFNENWVGLSVFAALLGLLLHQTGLLAVAVFLLTAAVAGWLWSRYSLRHLEYERSFSETRAFSGETIDITLQITNRKLLPISWLQVDDEYTLPLTILGGDSHPSSKPGIGLLSAVMSLRWFERVRWHYRVFCGSRGFYSFGPARFRSGDPFNLFDCQIDRQHLDWLIVYPKVKPIQGLTVPSKEPFGQIKARQRIFEDPSRTIGIRDYQAEDAFKRIHWKATARRQDLQVKVFEPTTTFQLVIFLNMATMPKHWQGTIPALLERAISVAASIANYAVEKRFQVGLVANGCWPQSDHPLRVLPSRSPKQLTHILEALAAVSAVPTVPIEALLTAETTHLPWGATLVVITAVVTDELLVVLSRLRTAGRRVVLLRLDDRPLPPHVPGITVHHVVDLETAFGLETERES